MRHFPPLSVDPPDAVVLRDWIEGGGPGAAVARRARIVLLAAQGHGPTAIAAELDCSKQTVITWRERFRSGGVDALLDAPRSGRPATVSAGTVITRTLAPPPPGEARWTSRALGAELGISNVSVANTWRAWGVRPSSGGQVSLATEPELDGVFSGVAALHIGAPARVLALWSGAPGTPAAVPPAQRPDLGDRPGDQLAAPGPASDIAATGPALLAEFLDDLGGLAVIGEEAAPTVSLVVAGATGPVRRRCAATGFAVHEVPSEGSWPRIVRVAALLAAATERGADSVVALATALGSRRSGATFTWLDT